MRRALRVLAVIIVVLCASAAGIYYWKNPERRQLDLAARENGTGDFVRLSDGWTHYESSGPDTGRVVVLVHGFSVPYYIWDSTAIGLSAAGYRVVRYDVFGRGYSDRPDAAYDGPFYARQLGELMDSLRITGPIHLMGLSFGGFVTGHYVAANPAKVRSLTLVDPVASTPSIPAFLRWPVVGNWVWQVMRAPGAADGQSSDFLHPEHWPDWADKYRPQMRYRGFGRSLRRSVIAASRTDYAAHYAAVGRTNVPVMLIWGKQDSTVSIALSNVVRDNIPRIEYVPVDSAGHLPHMEQAAVVRQAMLTFLASHR